MLLPKNITFHTILLCITVFMDKICRPDLGTWFGLVNVRLMFGLTDLNHPSNLNNSVILN